MKRGKIVRAEFIYAVDHCDPRENVSQKVADFCMNNDYFFIVAENDDCVIIPMQKMCEAYAMYEVAKAEDLYDKEFKNELMSLGFYYRYPRELEAQDKQEYLHSESQIFKIKGLEN